MAVISYRQALHDTLRAELTRDRAVFLLGEEIGIFGGSYKITAGLLAEFGPERVRDTPISEEGFVGAAIGAALLGLRPVVEIMTLNFSLLAIDQMSTMRRRRTRCSAARSQWHDDAEIPTPYAKPLELAALPVAGALAKVIREVLDATRFAG